MSVDGVCMHVSGDDNGYSKNFYSLIIHRFQYDEFFSLNKYAYAHIHITIYINDAI